MAGQLLQFVVLVDLLSAVLFVRIEVPRGVRVDDIAEASEENVVLEDTLQVGEKSCRALEHLVEVMEEILVVCFADWALRWFRARR